MNGYRRFANGLYAVNKAVSKVELIIISAIMAVLTLVMFWQVLTRYCLSIPATWAEELCRFLFIWASYIGSAYAVFSCEHIEIDLIDNIIIDKCKNPQRVFAWLKKIVILVIAVFCAYFFKIYFSYVLQIAKLKQFSGAMEIDMVYPMSSGIAGLGLIIFHAVSLLLMPLEEPKNDNKEDDA